MMPRFPPFASLLARRRLADNRPPIWFMQAARLDHKIAREALVARRRHADDCRAASPTLSVFGADDHVAGDGNRLVRHGYEPADFLECLAHRAAVSGLADHLKMVVGQAPEAQPQHLF